MTCEEKLATMTLGYDNLLKDNEYLRNKIRECPKPQKQEYNPFREDLVHGGWRRNDY